MIFFRLETRRKRLLKWFYQSLLVLLAIIILTTFLRVFIFSTFSIPTPSMEPTIKIGDHIIVNKLIPGPRLIKNLFSLQEGKNPDIMRLDGYRSIKRNDILVFNFPYSEWGHLSLDLGSHYVKRCVAIPGDTFYIKDGIYKVRNVSDTLGNYINQLRFSNIPSESILLHVYNCFPHDREYAWTVKNFGPLYVPAQGDTISLDTLNIKLYRNLITYETKREISLRSGQIILEDSIISKYIFQKNYYFMAGDYVFDSQDSRYWGLLPEDHIIGKVAYIWKSKDPSTGKYRFDRFLKSVE